MYDSSTINVLYVDDELTYCNIFRRMLSEENGMSVHTSSSGAEALKILAEEHIDIVFTDLLMPEMDGIELLKLIRQDNSSIFISVITSLDSATEAVKAMKSGANDYILKPLDFDIIRQQIENAGRHRSLTTERTRSDDSGFDRLVGQSTEMRTLFGQIEQVAGTDATVLICGESGTGKELIAESIHLRSRRKASEFIRVNCAALTDSLLSSTLFGYEKGAFTGAVSRKKGLFEAASGGTIFLDEIGDIPVQTQVALLRVLEQGSFQRVGGTESVNVDVRVICATNKDLSRAVADKTFREDLFYRINVVTITAPPLRKRSTDIPLLAGYFLEKYSVETGRSIKSIEHEVLTALSVYSWPGNVRELGNAIEHAVVFCKGETLTKECLPQNITETPASSISVVLNKSSLPQAEETLIRTVLEQHQWNLSKTATALNIARGTLYSKMKKLGIAKQ